VEVAICTLSGIIWYLILSKTLRNLQSKRMSQWQVEDSRPTTTNETTGQLNSVDGNFQKT
ncbi:hypothetical protein NL492_27245, partial [Klebsiella pneumoniae]|nr:hypothetical protein [Klebsiella pneumoniae]